MAGSSPGGRPALITPLLAGWMLWSPAGPTFPREELPQTTHTQQMGNASSQPAGEAALEPGPAVGTSSPGGAGGPAAKPKDSKHTCLSPASSNVLKRKGLLFQKNYYFLIYFFFGEH